MQSDNTLSSSPIQVHFLSSEEIEKLCDSEEESDDSKSDEKDDLIQFQPKIKNVILDPFTELMQKSGFLWNLK